MSQRLSPDRRSFTHFLSTLLKNVQMPVLRGSAEDRIEPRWLPGLTQIRQEVKGGKFDLNALINRLTKLIQGVVHAGGTANVAPPDRERSTCQRRARRGHWFPHPCWTIAASRTPPWLLSGWGCRGRRLSRA
jgi:hypothetical protein